jgi:hypothetical protein
MTFEVGAVLEDANWQAPVYCFEKRGDGNENDPKAQFAIPSGYWMDDGVLRGSINDL